MIRTVPTRSVLFPTTVAGTIDWGKPVGSGAAGLVPYTFATAIKNKLLVLLPALAKV